MGLRNGLLHLFGLRYVKHKGQNAFPEAFPEIGNVG
jgi:hypothetical protein